LARFSLRLEEISQSFSLMIALCQRMLSLPESDAHAFDSITLDLRSPPKGDATVVFEAPEGILSYSIVSCGDFTPHRVRVKTPSFSIMSAAHRFLQGASIQDLPLVFYGLGAEGTELDR